MKNSPAEFQRAVDSAFSHLVSSGVHKYINDIVIYTNDLGRMFFMLEEMLKCCRDCGFYLKIRKCEFISPRVLLLAHSMSELGIQPNPKNVKVVRDARP